MKCFRKPIDQKGVALFIVLASMATLGIFVGEITYTAQINQKLAYDRLDQVKAQALAKSGLRLALLRIRAYSELRKTIGKMASAAGASTNMVNSLVPKSMVEKIWSEPVTIPFTGDVSSLPGSVKDAIIKFRKDSGMEGKLYLSIQAQSNKFNLNTTLPSFAFIATADPKASGTSSPTPTPANYSVEQARQMLGDQIKNTFQRKFDEDEKFRDEYRSYRVEDLIEEILGWNDLSYESPRERSSAFPFKKAPFYHISELNFLPSMDDQVYELLSGQFSAGVASNINVNSIQETVLSALIPQMTKEEIKKFFEYRDGGGASPEGGGPSEDHQFKSPEDFYQYLKNKVQYFSGSDARISEFRNNLIQRGIQITTDESDFLVHIEATVQQTKKTLEAMVSIIDDAKVQAPAGNVSANTPTSPQSSGGAPVSKGERSNLKITQLRFL